MAEVIAVMSPKGGVGKTFFTETLAIALAKHYQKTLLIDANLYASNLSLYLGMKNHPTTLNEVLKLDINPERAIYHYSQNLYILPSSIHIESEENLFEANKFKRLLVQFNNKYDFIIIDTEPSMGKINKTIIKHIDTAFVVSTPDLPALITTQKLVILLVQDNIKSMLILNKVRHSSYELRKKDIEKLIKIPIIKEINYDNSIIKSVSLRKPLEKGKTFRKIENIAKDLINKKL